MTGKDMFVQVRPCYVRLGHVSSVYDNLGQDRRG
jgi:hypothetical protein